MSSEPVSFVALLVYGSVAAERTRIVDRYNLFRIMPAKGARWTKITTKKG